MGKFIVSYSKFKVSIMMFFTRTSRNAGTRTSNITHQDQPVQPSVSRPAGPNLQASCHSEVAQTLSSELTSSPAGKNKNQIKNKQSQSQIKTKKNPKPNK